MSELRREVARFWEQLILSAAGGRKKKKTDEKWKKRGEKKTHKKKKLSQKNVCMKRSNNTRSLFKNRIRARIIHVYFRDDPVSELFLQ